MHRTFQIALIVITWGVLALSFVNGEFLQDQPLHHIPTVLGLLALTWAARKSLISDGSMVAIILFIWLHILGARYVYSNVPYDDWSQQLLGFSITQKFHFTRNHYDRLVHVAYGALAMAPQVELLRRAGGLGRLPAHILSVGLVLGASAFYEIVEWTAAIVMAPDMADRYNGQQGDLWDAQKDMACAAIGAVSSSLILSVRRVSLRRNSAAPSTTL